jgi:hypothetical protein
LFIVYFSLYFGIAEVSWELKFLNFWRETS